MDHIGRGIPLVFVALAYCALLWRYYEALFLLIAGCWYSCHTTENASRRGGPRTYSVSTSAWIFHNLLLDLYDDLAP